MPRLKPPPGRMASARVAEVPEDETTNVLANPQDNPPPEEEVLVEDNPAPEEDASVAFQKQIEALRASERKAQEAREQAIRDREEALQRAREREAEVAQLRKTTIESQTEAIAAALAAAQADAEGAQRDLAAAGEAGDFAAQSAAYRRLAKAEAAISRLEDGKAELEERAKAPPPSPQPSGDPIDQMDISPNAKKFLKENRHYLTNPRLNAKMNATHFDLVEEGYEPFSDDYLEEIKQRMAPKKKQEPVVEEEVQPARRASEVVSAPVSREAPSSSGNGDRPGRVTLTVAQKEAAKMAGISEAEYAKQLLRLRQEKANGNYIGGQ